MAAGTAAAAAASSMSPRAGSATRAAHGTGERSALPRYVRAREARGKGRGGTGMRSAQELASACTGAAVEEVELLRVVEANARDGMGGSRGESSSAPPPPPRSRVLRQGGLEEEYAKNSPSPLGFAPRLIRHDRLTSYELASTSRPLAPEMGEPLCIITKKAMSKKNRAYTGGNQGRSSSALLPQSRFWQGMCEEAKKVLGIAKYSSSPSRLAARILCDKQVLPESAGTSRPVLEFVDESYQQWLCSQKSTSLVADVIAAVYHDQSVLSPSASTGTLSCLLVPSEEKIQAILGNLGKSVLCTEALHQIRILCDSSKGAQSFLNKCPDMIQVLIDLTTEWKSIWTWALEEERLSIVLSLSIHRPNRERIAAQKKLPCFLKQTVEVAIESGASAAASLVKVASIVSILSEFDMFRKSVLDIGVVTLLCNLLNFENDAVRKEAAIAVLALCGYIGNNMVTDDVLLLLDYLPKGPRVLEVICNQTVVEQLVNIVMAEHESGLVTSQGIYSALSLILVITQNDVSKMKVEHMENFMKWLRELSSNELPMQTMFQLIEIISLLSQRLYSHKPKEFVVKWRDDDDQIWYPLYAEVTIGRPISTSKVARRREWTDIKIVEASQSSRENADKSSSFVTGIKTTYKGKIHTSNCTGLPWTAMVPKLLRCPLSGKIMQYPVIIATGQSVAAIPNFPNPHRRRPGAAFPVIRPPRLHRRRPGTVAHHASIAGILAPSPAAPPPFPSSAH
uniref:RING-type E3 ubiquitin transferase n=1 Tax=Oryza barthii TaxID=65489 RepID=A0A0D3F5D3_9ORYZ